MFRKNLFLFFKFFIYIFFFVAFCWMMEFFFHNFIVSYWLHMLFDFFKDEYLIYNNTVNRDLVINNDDLVNIYNSLSTSNQVDVIKTQPKMSLLFDESIMREINYKYPFNYPLNYNVITEVNNNFIYPNDLMTPTTRLVFEYHKYQCNLNVITEINNNFIYPNDLMTPTTRSGFEYYKYQCNLKGVWQWNETKMSHSEIVQFVAKLNK